MGHTPSYCDTGALCASIAHEINQPLAAIVADASACRRWLAASPPNYERVEIIVQRILDYAMSAADIVGSLCALFTGRATAQVPAQINDVIRDVCASIAAGDVNEIEFVLQLDPALPAFAFDPLQVRQLLVNLVRNGVEAMAASPRRLTVRSCREQDRIRVEVCDLGDGVVDAERMFDAFFSTKANGMGLGLAICRQVVTAHGGRLWMERNQPRGTRMIFILPRRDAAARTTGDAA